MKAMVLSKYNSSTKRLFLLDYDGVLRELEPTPEQAAPTPELKNLLKDLAQDGANTVVIISGRGQEVLERWLGDLPLSFVAEHGMAYRDARGAWQLADAPSSGWQPAVRELMDQSVRAVPGSLIETKPGSLVWHYRVADQTMAEPERATLLAALSSLAKQYDLRVLASPKSKAVDVHPEGTDKGSAARRWFDPGDYDFILAVGDDLTDEDLFRAMPPSAFTIKVGEGETIASHRLSDPSAVRKLLAELAH